MNSKNSANRNAGGRPPKFDEPSRPVTLTLPESTLQILGLVDPDKGRAIVKLTQMILGQKGERKSQAEIVEMGAHSGVIIVGPSQALRRIPFLRMVEVNPARYVLALERGNDFRALEVAIIDLLYDLPETETMERELLDQLLELIRSVRRSARGEMVEIMLVAPDEEA
ncbi:MAG: hypothetical protein JNK37_02755 [Verrucomicrobiales bacterium]|nr:hypothetical protein [Verrucomicrobiales bacterium]